MDKEIYNKLLENCMLKDNKEIEQYEYYLDILAQKFSEDDIIELCEIFEDETHESEVMFSAIHLLETLSSEVAFENTVKGVVRIYDNSPEWAKTIVYRCLNDEFSVCMIQKICARLDTDFFIKFREILNNIKIEDPDRFGNQVDDILNARL